MAKYCKFKCYMHGAPPANWAKEYYAPMIGDNDIYYDVPMDGTTKTLLAASAEGYESQALCDEAISSALGYLPDVTFGLPYVSPASFDDEMFMDYLGSISPDYTRFLEYPWDRYYSPTPTSDYGVGNITLSGGICMCASFMKYLNQYPQGGENKAYMVDQAGIRRLEWEFTVFPYDVFRSGKFDFSTMSEAPSHPGNQDWKRYCNVRFQKWQYPYDYSDPELRGKWNCFVVYFGYDCPIDTLNDYYDGTDTEVYDSGKLLPNGQKNDDNPGDGTRPSDNIPIPSIPSGGMAANGSLRIYTLSNAQVKQLMEYLHSNEPAAAVMKWWTNPIDSIISLHYLPYALAQDGAAEELKILGTQTGLLNYQPAKQWQSIHFGYYDLKTDSGTYLDYSPYTKVSIYLPGVGIRDLNTDDVMNKRIWVVYHCDNVTGQFAAYIATGPFGVPENDKSVSVKYCFSGQVASAFPINQNNWGNTYIAGATLVAGAVANGVAGACAGAMAGGGAAAGEAAGSAGAGSEEGSVINAGAVAKGVVSVGNSLANLAKPSIGRSGAVSGSTSLFAVKKPYLIIESPNYYGADSIGDFGNLKGYPYGLFAEFSRLKGYGVIEATHLHNIPATVTEINEIEALLKSGVHF